MATYQGQTVDLLLDFEDAACPPTGWTETDANNVLAASTASKYDGSYGLDWTYTGTYAATLSLNLGADKGTISGGFWYRVPTQNNYAGTPYIFRAIDNSSNNVLRIRAGRNTSDNVVEVNLVSGASASSRITIAVNTWYWFAWKHVQNTTAYLTVYDTTGTIVGSEVTLSAPNYAFRTVYVGMINASLGQTSNAYWDSVCLDYTSATYPLLGWTSESSSVSPSVSPSESRSDSPSDSVSVSPSQSPSGSLSPSASPSPSIAPQDAVCWGYATPDAGEEAVTWKRWKLDASTTVTITGDADWGAATIDSGVPGYSPVTDTGDTNSKVFTVTPNKYASGTGTPIISIRGDTTTFEPFAGSPSWVTYTTPTAQAWRYVQVRIEA